MFRSASGGGVYRRVRSVPVVLPWQLPWIADWFDGSLGIAQSGGVVDSWSGIKGVRTFSASGGARPSYSNGVITFNGSTQYLYTGAFTLNQNWTAIIVGKQISWVSGASAMDGATTNSARLFQLSATPQVFLNAGSSAPSNTDWAIGANACVFVGFGGASSFIQVGGNAATTGNAGSGNAGGITLGIKGDRATEAWNGSVVAFGYATTLLSASQITQTLTSVRKQYGQYGI